MKYCVELSAGLDAAADYLYLDADDEYLPDTHPGVLLLFRPLFTNSSNPRHYSFQVFRVFTVQNLNYQHKHMLNVLKYII